MKPLTFTVVVMNSLTEGTIVTADCDGPATGMDAVAAIRAMVDRTAQLTRNSPEYILGLVEHHAVAFSKGELVKR